MVPKSCKFATRGGGHGAWAGMANIENSVTIDLRALNSTKLLDGNKLVSVGSGQSVGNIYTSLYPFGISVSAGRSYDVGVGGSTLGAGWGWLSNEAGFACDSIVEYEIVLANGTIAAATQTVHADLWKALKGGGNNFGIVTRFVFRTIPLGQIWNGDVIYALTDVQVPQLFSALVSFTNNSRRDPKATLLVSSSYTLELGYTNYVHCVYTAPVEDLPVIFDELLSIPGQQLLRVNNSTTLPELSYNYNMKTPNGFQYVQDCDPPPLFTPL